MLLLRTSFDIKEASLQTSGDWLFIVDRKQLKQVEVEKIGKWRYLKCVPDRSTWVNVLPPTVTYKTKHQEFRHDWVETPPSASALNKQLVGLWFSDNENKDPGGISQLILRMKTHDPSDCLGFKLEYLGKQKYKWKKFFHIDKRTETRTKDRVLLLIN